MRYKEFLNTLDGCPFCIRENHAFIDGTHAYLTYALAPYHKHHLLVLPKRHVESIEELTAEERDEIDRLQTEGLRLLQKLNYASVTLLVREGPVNVNKTVRHTHFHVIPQIQIGSMDHSGQERRILAESEIQEVVRDIQALVDEK